MWLCVHVHEATGVQGVRGQWLHKTGLRIVTGGIHGIRVCVCVPSTRSWSGAPALGACMSWCQQLETRVQGSYRADHIPKHSCWGIQVVLLYMHFPLRDLCPDQLEKGTGWFLLVLFVFVWALSVWFDLYGQLYVYCVCVHVYKGVHVYKVMHAYAFCEYTLNLTRATDLQQPQLYQTQQP